ncbi:T9SS type B sorting domain-containing protein [Winogradskyella sp. PG-2]|uniref:T9SS type B sorting domain-containing protein n=1 Tax=Winogradskyella sp. PG-2 TaxID=754409 RepID=UPI0014945B61|nr:T9SS type B sorting domain-containing protein [Winogradskyella sp. PG-2]
MRNSFLDLKVLIIFCISLLSKELHAQLGFCQGNSGDPIFTETFGTGTNYGPPLPAGTTTYNFIGNSGPQDGQYTVGRNTFSYGWTLPSDHTPGDTNGKALIVNANSIAEEFYTTSVSGLCENTTYEFSSWLINILPSSGCGGNGVPVNVQFEIWDNTNTNLLASGATGNIFSSATTTWEQYALVFQTSPGQTSIILKMINNAPSTNPCGNDLAIDDIVFKSCGDYISVSDGMSNASISICSSQTPYSTVLTATPDFTVFSNHFYQWQESTDGITWTDIIGETNINIALTGITTMTFYRTKVAESIVNVNNASCNTISDMFQVNVELAPTMPTTECWETATFNDTSCSWSVTGTQPAAPTDLECWETTSFNNTTCVWEITGTQPMQPTLECWETATFNDTSCSWSVTGTQPAAPSDLECWETTSFNNTTCVWEITGTQPMQPTLECWETATFNTTTCSWDVMGVQPVAPVDLECWETTTFNSTTCLWEVTGIQPTAPTGLECWETAAFNDTTCVWEITGSQPIQPTLECWETTTFDNVTCSWDVTGVQPVAPVDLECWETAIFNTTTCSWEITGIQPSAPTGLECWESTTFNNVTCSWDVTGTQPEEPTELNCWEITNFNSTTCSWEITGTQPEEPSDLECWESTFFNVDSCAWEITGTQPLEFRDEILTFCEGDDIELIATSSIMNPEYIWDSGEISQSITVDSQGTYVVEVTDGCLTEIITFIVSEIENPIIDNIITQGSSIIVNLANNGNYQYSIDGLNYQFSNVFIGLPSGLYTIYVKSNDCDAVVTQEHFHFYIQKFITPNADGDNDFFVLNVSQFFTSSEVYIFDRYGKLLFSAVNSNVFWDGTFNGVDLPTSDYWYRIVLDTQEFKGHFTLKR